MQKHSFHNTFSQLISQYEIAPVILLEIIADSCGLDLQYLLKCYYCNVEISTMKDIHQVECYLQRVFSEEDLMDSRIVNVPIRQAKP